MGTGTATGEAVLVEYSSPNIAKLFTIGHLRSTMIGHALAQANLYLGRKVRKLNHLGDWGTQFGALLAAYKKWAESENAKLDKNFEWAEQAPENRQSPLYRLFQLYVRFHQEEKDNEALRDDARRWFKLLEAGDTEARRLWAWFREISLAEFNRIYERLGVSFDDMDGESFYEDKLADTVGALKESGLLEEGEGGAKRIRLDDVGIQAPCIVLKGDGASIYATRDLAAALYRKSRYAFQTCIYVVGSDQVLHFQQVFAVLDKLDPWFKGRMLHAPFGMVKLPTGKMSTREGNVIFLEDVLDEAVSRVMAIIEEKNPSLPNKREIAEMLGIGAVIFFDAMNDRIKPITFSWDRAIALDGDTGPYVQYAHARICSVLRKAGGGWPGAAKPIGPLSPKEARVQFPNIEIPSDLAGLANPFAQALLFELAGLHDAILAVQRENMATALARQLVSIARAFSGFYTNCPILWEENTTAVREARLSLCAATARVLRQGLWLLGIKAPEEM
jgi:arginyl-tRNA synthetase